MWPQALSAPGPNSAAAAALQHQAMVGARTDARLVNIPQSEAWARRIKHGGGAPEEVSPREVLQPMGAT